MTLLNWQDPLRSYAHKGHQLLATARMPGGRGHLFAIDDADTHFNTVSVFKRNPYASL